MKTCSICKEFKDLSMFCKEKANKDGHGSRCKVCNRLVAHAWAKTNPEQRKVQTQLDRQRHKRKRQETSNRWARSNPGFVNAKKAKRLADKEQRTPKWLTKEDLKNMRSMYMFASELTKQGGIKIDVDHIIPLRGENISGLHCPQNLQFLTHTENMLKGNRF
jgi:hypothetical protein